MKHKNPPILLALQRRPKIIKSKRKVAREICFNTFLAEKLKNPSVI